MSSIEDNTLHDQDPELPDSENQTPEDQAPEENSSAPETDPTPSPADSVAGSGDTDTEISEDQLFGVYRGELIKELPKDLYIPPDALEIFLEQFEGPLDLLLYLIRRQNLDILDIPITEITRQYVQYIELMQDMQFELAAEYLVMAAMLAEIKSRMLLPRPEAEEEDEDDPRAELVRRLQEYERYKKAGQDLDQLERFGRDTFNATAEVVLVQSEDRPIPKLEMTSLLRAFQEVLVRAEMFSHHHIQKEALSVRERMTRVLEAVQAAEFVEFTTLFDPEEGRMGVVVTFLSILELIKESLLEIVQSEAFAKIHIRAKASAVEEDTSALERAEMESMDATDDSGEQAYEPDTDDSKSPDEDKQD